MKLLRRVSAPDGGVVGYVFLCPGCSKPHMYRTKRMATESPTLPVWQFDGNEDLPTFTPSLLVHEVLKPDGSVYQPRCHLFLTAGKIQFCGDSKHALAGQVVDLPEFEW